MRTWAREPLRALLAGKCWIREFPRSFIAKANCWLSTLKSQYPWGWNLPSCHSPNLNSCAAFPQHQNRLSSWSKFFCAGFWSRFFFLLKDFPTVWTFPSFLCYFLFFSLVTCFCSCFCFLACTSRPLAKNRASDFFYTLIVFSFTLLTKWYFGHIPCSLMRPLVKW